MQKCKEFFKKHFKTTIAVCVIAVIALAFAFTYIEKISTLKNQNITENLYKAASGEELSQCEQKINNGDVLKQDVTIRHGTFYGIYLQFANIDESDTGKVNVTLQGSNIDENIELSIKDLAKDLPTYVIFKEPLFVDNQSTAVLKITPVGVQSSNFSIITVKGNSDKDKQFASLNTQELDVQAYAILCENSKKMYNIPFIMFCVVSVLLLAFIFVFLRKSKLKDKLPITCMIILIVFGMFYNIVFTPLSIPDEQRHYVTAMSTSNKLMGNFSDGKSGTTLRTEDADFYNNSNSSISEIEYDRVYSELKLFATKQGNTVIEPNPLKNKEIDYLFPAIGITLCRLFNFSGMLTFYIGRLFNILFMALCLFFAMKRMPYGKIVPFVICMLPMTLHLTASYSYDVYTIGLSLVLFAELLRSIYKPSTFTWKNMAVLTALAFIALPQKAVYFWIAFLVLLIPKDKFISKTQRIVTKVAVSVIGIVGIGIVQFTNIFSSTYNDILKCETYSLTYIFTHPTKVIAMIARTTSALGTFYYESMIGKTLGWFQISIPTIFIYGFTIILILAFLRKDNEPKAKPTQRLFAVLLFGLIFCTTLAFFMHDWTKIGSRYIDGVQGRYFIPCIPLLYLFIRNNKIVAKPSLDRYIVFGTTILSSFTLMTFFIQILQA